MMADRRTWLFTIAHEEDAVLCLEPAELKQMQKIPSIASLLIPDPFYREEAAT